MKKQFISLALCLIFINPKIQANFKSTLEINAKSVLTGIAAGITSTIVNKSIGDNIKLKSVLIPLTGLLTIKYLKPDIDNVYALDILTYILTTAMLSNIDFFKNKKKPDQSDESDNNSDNKSYSSIIVLIQ